MAKSNQEKQTRKPSDCNCTEQKNGKTETRGKSKRTSDCKNCK